MIFGLFQVKKHKGQIQIALMRRLFQQIPVFRGVDRLKKYLVFYFFRVQITILSLLNLIFSDSGTLCTNVRNTFRNVLDSSYHKIPDL